VVIAVRGLIYVQTMDITSKHNKRLKRGRLYGFALAEMMISIALIALIATVVSMAISGSYKRSDQTRQSISDRRKVNNCFKRIEDHLRLAVNIYEINPNYVYFQSPDSANGGAMQERFIYWDHTTDVLYIKHFGQDWVPINSEVVEMQVDPDMVDESGIICLRGLTLYLKVGASDGESRYIELPNRPHF